MINELLHLDFSSFLTNAVDMIESAEIFVGLIFLTLKLANLDSKNCGENINSQPSQPLMTTPMLSVIEGWEKKHYWKGPC